MEQWRITSSFGYKEIINNEVPAKRTYGSLKKQVNEDEEGWVKMYYRSDINQDWILIQELVLSDDDEDEESND